MDRYLDGSYQEPSSGSGGIGLILAIGALVILFGTRDGRDLVRIYIYIIGGIFTVAPLLFNPSMFSIWWPLVVAIAFFSDRWEDNREKKKVEERTRQYSSRSEGAEKKKDANTSGAPINKSERFEYTTITQSANAAPPQREKCDDYAKSDEPEKSEGQRKSTPVTRSENPERKAAQHVDAIEEDQKLGRNSRKIFHVTSSSDSTQLNITTTQNFNASFHVTCPECCATYAVPLFKLSDYTSLHCTACNSVWRQDLRLDNIILIELKSGTVVIQLLPEVAPRHVARMKELARAGAYDSVIFHRVIEGFIAQTGDVKYGNIENEYNLYRAGTGGSDLPDLTAEFSKVPHNRGTLAAARGQSWERRCKIRPR